MTQVFHDPYVPPSDVYVPPVIDVQGWSHAIEYGVANRVKAIPPFSTAAKFARSTARPTQAEHIPFVGVYFLDENLIPEGDLNHTEPKFISHLKLGFSYIIQNDDPDTAASILRAAYWSFMKLFHAVNWSKFPYPHPDYPDRLARIEGVSAITHDCVYGNIGHNNETPIAELRMEITYVHKFDFEPVPLDKFELVHMETWPWPAQPDKVKPIITEWTLPQPP
jgi:hypothetical protein